MCFGKLLKVWWAKKCTGSKYNYRVGHCNVFFLTTATGISFLTGINAKCCCVCGVVVVVFFFQVGWKSFGFVLGWFFVQFSLLFFYFPLWWKIFPFATSILVFNKWIRLTFFLPELGKGVSIDLPLPYTISSGFFVNCYLLGATRFGDFSGDWTKKSRNLLQQVCGWIWVANA